MKAKFINSLWEIFSKDIRVWITLCAQYENLLGLTDEQKFRLSVLKNLALADWDYRSVYQCSSFFEDIMEEDCIADHVDMIFAEDARIEHYNLMKLIVPVFNAFVALQNEEKRKEFIWNHRRERRSVA